MTATVAVACTGSGSGSDSSSTSGSVTPSSQPSPGTGTVRFKLMEFNIEYGGTQVDFASVPKAIKASGADVVGVEEGYATMPKIAEALGWNYYDERTQIVSRFPLLRPADGSQYTYVEVTPGRVVAIANEHLPSWSYGPDHVRNGMPLDKILHVEEALRVPAVKPAIEDLAPLAVAGVPSFIMGDFNTPSHLDWTAAALRDQPDRFPVDWPVGEAVEAAGFRDSYRQLFPDPVKDPGLTWPANRPFVAGYNPYRHGDPRDRIDFIYDGGPARPIESKIVGEGGVPGVDIVVSPWPTDHRGEVTTFEVTPAVPPVLALRRPATDHDRGHGTRALPRAGRRGRAHRGRPDRRRSRDGVGRRRPDHRDGRRRRGQAGERLDGRRVRRGAARRGRATAGHDAAVGRVTRSGAGDRHREDYLRGRRADRRHVELGSGQPVGLDRRLPAQRRHRVVPRLHLHRATVQGTGTVDCRGRGTWPLKPGKYSVYLLRDDDYVKLASADFTIAP